eukprot:11175087-Lingulodinium_polyedra.AAC.1
MRGPVFGSRVVCASVLFASRCDGGTSSRPRHCAAFRKRCNVAVQSMLRGRGRATRVNGVSWA